MELDLTAKIKVTANISAGFREHYTHLKDRQIIELDQPETVKNIISRLGISSRMVLMATIDGRIVDKKTLIKQSCEINLVSPPAGG